MYLESRCLEHNVACQTKNHFQLFHLYSECNHVRGIPTDNRGKKGWYRSTANSIHCSLKFEEEVHRGEAQGVIDN